MMETLRDRVAHLLQLREMTQAAATRKGGFANTAFINDIMRGHKIDVRGQNLTKLATALSTSEDFLAARTDDPQPRRTPLIPSYDPDAPDPVAQADEAPKEGVDIRASWPIDAIPELVARGGLGSGHTINTLAGGEMNTVDEVKDDYWKFPSSFVRGVLDTRPPDLVVIECDGDSMEPTLRSGDRVYVNAAHRTPSPDGLYALRDAFGAIIIKRLEVASERPIRLRIISDNPKHSPREVGPDEVTVVGKVVAGLKLF